MILVFDTSTSHLAIGLADSAGNVLSEFHADASENERGIHDAHLAAETAKLISNAGITASHISKIGLIIGPGSFTGLRIGLSFAKGLSYASGAALVPLTQHEVMSKGYIDNVDYLITPGYQPELFYFAEASKLQEIRLMKKAELWSLPEKPTLAHDLLQLHPDRMPWPCSYTAPSLVVMASMAAKSGEVIVGDEIDALEPLYITEFKTG
jgi:tRNA threonylcarbamoyl adenosine modification protein YeaZ